MNVICYTIFTWQTNVISLVSYIVKLSIEMSEVGKKFVSSSLSVMWSIIVDGNLVDFIDIG